MNERIVFRAGRPFPLLSLIACVIATACGSAPDAPVVPVHQTPTFIIDPPTNQNIDVGDTVTYSGRVAALYSLAPAGPSSLLWTSGGDAATIGWSSSDSMIASIDSKGFVRALRSGTVTITGGDPAGLQSRVELHVLPPIADVRIISDKKLPLAFGDTATLTFAAIDSTGAVVPGIPLFWFQTGFGFTMLNAPPIYKEFTSPGTMRLTFNLCCDGTIFLGSFNIRASRQHTTFARIGG